MATNYVNKAITAKGISQINGKPLVDLELRETLDTDISTIEANARNALTIASTANVNASAASEAVTNIESNTLNYVLERLYSKEQVNALLAEKTSVRKTSDIENDSGFITVEALDTYATSASVAAGYIAKEEIANYATKGDLEEIKSIAISDASDISLNDESFRTTGIYAITGALDSPTPSVNGILTVRNYGDVGYFQSWDDVMTGHATRFPIYIADTHSTCVVRNLTNDTVVEPTQIDDSDAVKYVLQSGKSYSLTGFLYGHIEINGSTGKAVDLDINNLVIESDIEQAIAYGDTKSLNINISGENYIRVLGTADASTTAVIYSRGDIKLNGLGKLFIDNQTQSNHGIKGDDISIFSNPYIHIDNHGGHDGIHANRCFSAQGGYLNFKNCNDGIDCDGTNLLIVNTTLDCDGLNEDLVAASNAIVGYIVNSTLPEEYTVTNNIKILTTDDLNNRAKMVDLFGDEDAAEVYYVKKNGNGDYVIDTTHGTNGYVEYNSNAGYYDVKVNDPDNNNELSAAIYVKGYLGNRQIHTGANTLNNDVTDGLKIFFDTTIMDGTDKQCILYEALNSRVNIKVNEYAFAIIANRTTENLGAKYGAIKSKNNIKISGDGALYAISKLSDALDADDIIIEGDGFRSLIGTVITNDKYGISCKELYIGVDPKDVALGNVGKSYQTVITNSVLAALNKDNEKGTISIWDNSVGLFVAPNGSIYAAADNGFTDPNNLWKFPEQVVITASQLVYPERANTIDNTTWYVEDRREKAEGRTELDGFDFATPPTAPGDFYVRNALNSPFTDENEGLLSIMRTNNGFIETWSGKNYTGFRELKNSVNPVLTGINNFFINGTYIDTSANKGYGNNDYRITTVTESDKDTGAKRTIKAVYLRYGKAYTLSGTLTNVRIYVDSEDSAMPADVKEVYESIKSTKNTPSVTYVSSETGQSITVTFDSGANKATNQAKFLEALATAGYYIASDTTSLILDGLYMHFNDYVDTSNEDSDKFVEAAEAFIEYTGTAGICNIALKNNTVSYLTRTMLTGMKSVNNGSGIIYASGKNAKLVITGPGTLVLNSNLGGHGIKSKGDLYIMGSPKIYNNTYHDFAHGKTGLYIKDGSFHIAGCNDVFGTNTITSDQEIGKIRIYGGIFTIENCKETVVQGDDVVVYPGVTFKYKNVGEGLWIETVNPETQEAAIELTDGSGYALIDYKATGDLAGFYVLDTTVTPNVFSYYELPEPLPYTTDGNLTYNSYKTLSAITTACGQPIISKPYYGITPYTGVVTIGLSGSVYKESHRNTPHDNTEFVEPDLTEVVTNDIIYPDGTTIGDIKTENENSQLTDFDLSSISFSSQGALVYSEDVEPVAFLYKGLAFNYSGQLVSGGNWNIGITEEKFNSYKDDVNTIVSNLMSMIVPPKNMYLDLDMEEPGYSNKLKEVVYARDGLSVKGYEQYPQLATVLVSFKNTYTNPLNSNEQCTLVDSATGKEIKYGEYIYGTKTGIQLHVGVPLGGSIKLKCILDPVNVTNQDVKWKILGEYQIIGRVVSEDTHSCTIVGLKEGDETLLVSCKSLNKDYAPVSLKIKVSCYVPEEP